MRHYECECLKCGRKAQIAFQSAPYPEIGEAFVRFCPSCSEETQMQRVLTWKAAAELRRRQAEADLRQSILARCAEHGFQCRFLYQSVIIATPLSDWCFDYHTPKKTLYHESTTKINFTTGDYAKAHVQIRDRHMSPIEVIDYIAVHDSWRAAQAHKCVKHTGN